MAQGLTDEQLKLRAGKYMASDAAAYQGMSPYSSPLSSWALNLGYDTLETNDSMQAGIHLERGLIEWAAEKLGAEEWESPGTVFHITYPWAGCTPDAFLNVEGFDKSLGIQIKCHGLHMAKDYGTPGESSGNSDNDLIPEHYLIQCMWEMFVVSGTDWNAKTDIWYLGAYFGGADFRIFQLKRDQDMIDLMVEFAERFWKQHLDPTGKQEAPPLDGTDASTAFIRRRSPINTKPVLIDPPDGAEEWAERYHHAHKTIGEWEAAKNEAKNHLSAMCEDHDGIEGICTYKAPKPKTKVDWESAFHSLAGIYDMSDSEAIELADKHAETKQGNRTFLLKWRPNE